MGTTNNAIAIFGAVGHTGRFVVHEARRRGLPVVAIGRDITRLRAAFPTLADRREAQLNDDGSLQEALVGCAIVVNCAGPFLDTANAVAAAALRSGCHYIDVTAEQASAQATFNDFAAPAIAAGRVVIPAAGFYGGLADLLASALAADGEIDDITVAVALDHWWPTLGTRKTGARNTIPRVVVAAGRLAPLTPSDAVPDWHFDPPIGTRSMVELPFSEIITMAQHLSARSIRSLINRSAIDEIRDASTPAPLAIDDVGRSAQRFELVVRVAQDGQTHTASARGQDIYAVTAPIVIETATRLLQPTYARSGTLSLAQAVDPLDLLRALNTHAFDVSGIEMRD